MADKTYAIGLSNDILNYAVIVRVDELVAVEDVIELGERMALKLGEVFLYAVETRLG